MSAEPRPYVTSRYSRPNLGNVFTLDQFGWRGFSYDIAPYLQAAVDMCVAAGGGVVELPAGYLICDDTVTVPAPANAPSGGLGSIIIRGQGVGTTQLFMPNTPLGIVFNGTASAFHFFGGLESLSLYGNGHEGTAVRLINCVGTHLREVDIRDWGTSELTSCGLQITDTGGDSVCQNISLDRVWAAHCAVGIHVVQLGQMTMSGCVVNGNKLKGFWVQHAAGISWDGGMIQGSVVGAQPVHLDPIVSGGIVGMHFGGGIYLECVQQPGISQFLISGSGVQCTFGTLIDQGQPTYSDNFVCSATDASVCVLGHWSTPRPKFKGRNMRALKFVGGEAKTHPTEYDFDAATLAATTVL